MTGRVREQVVMLGPRKSLVGIVASGASDGAQLPAIVILNAGIIHRVGPNRMFVTLARRLAAVGHTVVRFDLSGIGDSEPRSDGLAPLEASLADIRDVLDSLTASRQINRVILIGLCSGADQAVVYGGTDPRIVGIVQIDASIPRTSGYYLHHYRGRMFRLASWTNFITGRHPFWSKLLKRSSPTPPKESESDERAVLQTAEVKDFLTRAYSQTVGAGIHLLSVFTSDLESQHNYREQLLDAFPSVPFGKQLRLEYFAATDHTFTPEADREELMKIVCEWVAQRSGALEQNTAA
jgi:pimeloyl-ACP methyl ester carboxylesterase